MKKKQKTKFPNEKAKGGIKLSAKRPSAEESSKCAFIRVNDVMEILGISSTAAYSLVRQAVETHEPFIAIAAGGVYLVQKASFDRYIGNDRSEDPPNV